MRLRSCSYGILLALAWPNFARAGSEPIIEPIPAWVVPSKVETTNQASTVNLFDRQIRIDDKAFRIFVQTELTAVSAESLAGMGNLQFIWQPDKGDLYVHFIELVRDDKAIDVLASGQKLSVLRREASLERSMLDGVLTATLQVPGIQVGDRLRFAYSVTVNDPALGGHVNGSTPLNFVQAAVAQSPIRISWPSNRPVKWQLNGLVPAPVIKTEKGRTELLLTGPFAPAPEIPGDAPARFRIAPGVEFSDFQSWEAVSAITAPLYDPKDAATKDAALASEIARIAAQSADPKIRAAAALRLVQDKVRYVFNGMAGGNYTPTPPGETWLQRLGDCKAKTLLLITLLRGLGIEAEPALVNATLPNTARDRLPSFQAFDHVIVRAMIDGKPYWLDGTASGDRFDDLGVVPNFGVALPVRAVGAGLETLVATGSARPDVEMSLEINARAGLAFPAPYTGKFEIRGRTAAMLKIGQATLSKTDFQKLLVNISNALVPDASIVSSMLRFDDERGIAELAVRGIANMRWTAKDARRQSEWTSLLSKVSINADRAGPENAKIPVIIGDPSFERRHTTVLLPRGGTGFSLEGQKHIDTTVAGVAVKLDAKSSGDSVSIDETTITLGGEIPASALATARADLARVQASPLQIAAPADYPGRSVEIAAAKGTKLLQPLIAAYDESVRSNPKDASTLLDRARFLEGIGDVAKALTDLGGAIGLKPDVETYLWRARLRTEKDPAGAVADITSARGLEPTSQDALNQLVALRAGRKEFDLATREIDEAITLGMDKADLLSLRATIEENAGKLDTALATLQSAVELTSGNPEVLNALCWMKATNKRSLDTALKDCTKAVERSDDPAAALDSRGVVYLQMGRYDDAIADFDAALKLNPDLGPTLFVRGIAKHRKGEKEAGDSDIASARQIVPGIDATYAKFGLLP